MIRLNRNRDDYRVTGVADRLGWYSAHVVHRTGHAISYDLIGTLPRVLAGASSVLQVVAVALVAWLYARGRDEPQRLAVAFAGAVTGFLAFTRFFSPQYLVWLVPLVVLLWPLEWALTAASLVLAQVWFFHYGDVFALGGRVWLVSKCGPRVEEKTRRWLEHHRFFELTGVAEDHLRFCRERPQKREHALDLGLTHFVDDRRDVLHHLGGAVPHLFLFTGDWPATEASIVASLNGG